MKHNRKFFSKNVLTKLVSTIKLHKIASFDCETYGYKNNFMQGGIYINHYKSFLDRDEMIKYIEENTDKYTTIYATNLMFDFECLYKERKEWSEFKRIMRNGMMLTAKYKHIKYGDTLNYSASSVKELGKLLGFEKIYYKSMIGKQPRTKYQWKKLIEYNSRDCLITKKFIDQFQEVCNKLGCEMRTTIASTALDLYRRKYMPFSIYKEHFKCKDFIFESYYGGRVENFKRGKLQQQEPNYINDKYIGNKYKIYYWYDYASAYPSVMRNEFPQPNSARMNKTKMCNIGLIKKYHGVSECIVECDEMRYPILPYRYEGKLIFPVGKFRGTYTHIELRYALQNGYKIKKIFKTIYYNKTFYPFKKYVETLYTLRLQYKKDNNLIYSQIVKILLNSLYGKFGTRSMQDITFMHSKNGKGCKYTDDEILGMQVTNINEKENTFTGYKEVKEECEQNYVIPILPSYVTAYQRINLHKDLVRLNGIYCDTDSILSEVKVQTGNNLGDLQIEKIITKGILVRPKLYFVYDNTTKLWNRKAKGIRGVNDEVQKLILHNKKVKQVKFTKVKEALRRKYASNQKITMYKYQDLEDSKRVWEKEFNINELQDSKPIYINDIRKQKDKIDFEEEI